ncbi:fructose-bisphosphatase [Tribonema minus]|uniref:fructose-bisphosphatase n=1 Tax=Tribonema minus TaxID=303371 RepID=A0A835Z219_9STRA|nr:fructose-bisphosphatase [Tribonema minus]
MLPVRNSASPLKPHAFVEQPSLLEHVSEQAAQRPGEVDDDMVILFGALQKACKVIAHRVRLAAIHKATGLAEIGTSSGTGGVNISGDRQKKLDVVSNDVLVSALLRCGKVGVIASEEEGAPVVGTAGAPYVAVFDPLDGSSNVDASIPTGTIFGIYRTRTGAAAGAAAADAAAAAADALQAGSQLVAGGYVLYGASTVMVVSLGAGTHMFTLDATCGEFVLTRASIRIPPRGRSYSLNEAREGDWPPGLRRYIGDVKRGRGATGERYELVYICSLVADVHHVMLHGGLASNPRSHLRLVYEGNPMGFVVEQAGGKASTGVGPILEEVPQDVHQRIPTFLGSAGDIEELESYGREHGGVQQLGNKTYAI